MLPEDIIDITFLIERSALISGCLAVLVLFAPIRSRRGRTNGVILKFALSLGLFSLAAVIGMQLIAVTNRVMDRSPTISHAAPFLAKFTGSGRSRTVIVVRSWRDGEETIRLFRPDTNTFLAAKEGDVLDVSTRSGFWGYERIVGYQLARR